MTKHTPGPWHRNIKADGKYPIIFAGRNQHVAQATQQKDGSETEANISLIAAAPELLEALRDIVSGYRSGDLEWSEVGKRIEAAYSVIAKATGE